MYSGKGTNGLRSRVAGLVLLACIGVILLAVWGGVCLSRIVNTAQGYIDTTMGKTAYLRQAEVAFAKMHLTLAGYVSHHDPAAVQEEAAAELRLLFVSLLSASDQFLHMAQWEGMPEELVMVTAFTDRFQHYREIAESIIDAGFVNDRERNEALLAEVSPLGEECAALLQHVSNLQQDLAGETYDTLQARSNLTMVVLFMIAATILAIMLVLLAAVFVGLKRAEDEAVENSLTVAIPSPAFTPTSTYSHRDQTLNAPAEAASGMLVEFDKRLSELKAVAYDLTRLTKERGGKS